jgi:hypothetical protein
MKALDQIRCSVYLHGDQDAEDAALVERLALARPGRRAQRFLAIVRSGIAWEQGRCKQLPLDAQAIGQRAAGRRMVVHLKLRQSFQPQIVAEIQSTENRSGRLRELAIRGLRAEAVPTGTQADNQSTPDIASHVPTPASSASSVEVALDDPLDAMLSQFVSMTENGP